MILFIIGNGFDLYHDYKTSYLNFKDFLTENANAYKIGDFTLIDILSSEESFEFWKDFEENLAKISLERISYGYNEKEEYSRSNNNIVENIKDVNEELYPLIQDALSDFIAAATKEVFEPKSIFLDLFGLNDKFISFNYSITLERSYNIRAANINYIHGVCNYFREDENNTSIVFGHSGIIPDSLYADKLYLDDDHPEYLKAKIRDGLTKYLDIYNFDKFIGNIAFYDEIQIIGHFLGIVDERYFEKLNTINTKKIIYWEYITEKTDEQKIIQRLKTLFPNVNCFINYYDDNGVQRTLEI